MMFLAQVPVPMGLEPQRGPKLMIFLGQPNLKECFHLLVLQASIPVPQMDRYQCLPFSYPFIKNDGL